MHYFRPILILIIALIHHVISNNFRNDQKYIFKVINQQFSAFNFRGRVIPPVDIVFEGDLHLQVLPNDTYFGQFLNTKQYGNVRNKGNLEMPFLIETKENRIDNIRVSKEWENKGIRYVYDILKDILRDYSNLTSLNNSIESLSKVNLPLGQCNATIILNNEIPDEKIIIAKGDKTNCDLDQDFIEIIGDDARDILTDGTFNEVHYHQKQDKELFSRLEITMNIRAEDPHKEFLMAMVSSTEIVFDESHTDEKRVAVKEELIKHSRAQILEY